MKLQNGDVIWREMRGNPLLNHYGILVDTSVSIPLVAHHTDGGASIVSLDRFLGYSKLRGSETTPISGSTSAEMLAHFADRSNEEFNIIFNNCEAWARKMSKNGTRMQEIGKAILYLVAVVLVLKAIKII